MGSALSLAQRRLIVKEKLGGKTLKAIAQEHQLSYSTTCNIWGLFKQKGLEGLKPGYHNCGPKTIKGSYKVYRGSKWLKRKHPKWGAPFIRTILKERYPKEEIPAVRTMQVWFRKAGLNHPRAYRKEPKVEKVEAVHDCWQIDAKENLKLADNSTACYLTVVDVKSGAVLETPLFPKSQN